MQPSILAPVPSHAAFVELDVRHGADVRAALAQVAALRSPDSLVVGLGPGFLASFDAAPAGFGPMPALERATPVIPSTPHDLFLRIQGADPGDVLHRQRALLAALPAFEVAEINPAYMYGASRDLTGFEDGTENPTGEDAIAAAFAPDGSSVVVVQRWVHDLDIVEAMGGGAMSRVIGRDLRSNEELDDAPDSAHVKRTAQEDFTPEAFVLRRSMPWSDTRGAGLVFVSFSATLAPFTALLRRMTGHDDGTTDALFTFTKPVTGATYWCPPVADGALDLSALA